MVFRSNLKKRLNPFRTTLGSLKVEKRAVNVDETESTEDSFFQSQQQRQRQRQDKSFENDQSMIPKKLRIRNKGATKAENLRGHTRTTVAAPTASIEPTEISTGSSVAAAAASPITRSRGALADGDRFQHLREHFYFYGSFHAIQIYCVVIGAIWFQRIFILHGITLILLKVIFWRLVAWGGYFLQLKEAQQGVTLIKWLVSFGLSTAEGAIEGKNVSKLLTGSTINFWKNRGTNFVIAWLRENNTQMNRRFVADMKSLLAQAETARQRHHAKFR